jgi:hypothetical protein
VDVDVVNVVLIEEGLRTVEGLTRPRGLDVDGEEKVGRVTDDRRRLDVFFKGVGLSRVGLIRGMKGDGTAGRDKEALGVVLMASNKDGSEGGEMSVESRSGGGAVFKRFSVEGSEVCES